MTDKLIDLFANQTITHYYAFLHQPINSSLLSLSSVRISITSPVRQEPDGNAYRAPGHLLWHGVEEDDGAHKHDVTQHTHHGHHTEDAADVWRKLLVIHLWKK